MRFTFDLKCKGNLCCSCLKTSKKSFCLKCSVSFHVHFCIPKLRKLQVEEVSALPFTVPWFGYLSSSQVIFLSADFKGLGMYRSERGKIMCIAIGK